MNQSNNIIAVTGATGAQGGGLVRAILRDPDKRFRARAITRNPESDRARALAAAGAEVVKADLDDADSLVRAFDGAHGAYCVTNFWEHFSPEREIRQAGNLAAAAETVTVAHVVWSTLEDTRRRVPLDDDRMPTLMGEYKVPHFDAKGAADREFTDRGLPTTFLLTSFYWDNLVNLGAGPRREDDGTLALVLPMGDKPLPGIAVEDIGCCAFGIFRAGDAYVGRRVGVAGEHLTGEEMAAALGRALGEPVRYRAIEPEAYRGLDFPGAADLGNMYQYKRDFNEAYCAARDPKAARELCPGLADFETWLVGNADRIPVEQK